MSIRLLPRSTLRTPTRLTPSSTSLRPFASTTPKMGKQEWMVILPDNAGALETRMKVRPQHLEDLKPKVESGVAVFGGASLDEPLKEGEGPKINGSVMIIEADTKAEVEDVIKSDIYYKEGVWNASKMQIFPFKSAIRKELQ